MGLDWLLASLHHLAVFSLAAILAFEIALTGQIPDARAIARLARVDAWYGGMAAVALAAGLLRIFLGAKGADYYLVNSLFWIKMALFAGLGAVSVLPTIRYIVWRRASRADDAFMPAADEVAAVRRWLWIEAGLFGLIPIAAAGMARGFGM